MAFPQGVYGKSDRGVQTAKSAVGRESVRGADNVGKLAAPVQNLQACSTTSKGRRYRDVAEHDSKGE